MPRGMDERFQTPADEEDETEAEGQTVETKNRSDDTETSTKPTQSVSQDKTESQSTSANENSGNPLNIRKDWDSATIYVEPEQSEDIEVTFTRLKKQLQREGVTLEKNKHFYRGIFEIAFDMHREETIGTIRELAKKDAKE
jgi:hypothetical protein